MLFKIKDANRVTIENVHHSPFRQKICQRYIFIIIATIKLISKLTNLKAQRVIPWQFLFGVKCRKNVSYWQECSFEFFKTT